MHNQPVKVLLSKGSTRKSCSHSRPSSAKKVPSSSNGTTRRPSIGFPNTQKKPVNKAVQLLNSLNNNHPSRPSSAPKVSSKSSSSSKKPYLKKKSLNGPKNSRSNSLETSLQEMISGSKRSKGSAVETSEDVQTANKSTLREPYSEIVERVFKRIDFFDKNSLEAANINKWISQTVLYFFGPIFHKIRSGVKMSRAQFFRQTELVFESSSYKDIANFIQSALPSPQAMPDSAKLTRQYYFKKAVTAHISPRNLYVPEQKEQNTDLKVLNSEAKNGVQWTLAHSGGVWDQPHRRQLRLSQHLDFQNVIAAPQTLTPLFSDGSQALVENRRFQNTSNLPKSVSLNPQQQTDSFMGHRAAEHDKPKILFKDMEMKKSFNFPEAIGKPEESKVQRRISLIVGEEEGLREGLQMNRQNKENERREANHWKALQKEASEEEAKIGQLKDRLDYFIKKNSEYLEISKNVRLQNGF